MPLQLPIGYLLLPALSHPEVQAGSQRRALKLETWHLKPVLAPKAAKTDCATVPPTFLNQVSYLHEKIAQLHSFCVPERL
jgi:hypothetical protein